MIEILGTEKLTATTAAIGGRLEDLSPGFEQILPAMEAAERSVFASLGGKYVLTGRLEASLTEPSGQDAVRRVTASSLEFGSSVPWARFQVVDPGPKTAKGGLKRSGHPSAVIRLNAAEEHLMVDQLGEYVMRGVAL
jgi:hypothetical protein